MKDLTYLPKSADTVGWKERHLAEIRRGHPVASAIQTWLDYAVRHKRTFDSQIGSDYVLGDAWAEWGFALRRLLNGECGHLDCGTLLNGEHLDCGTLDSIIVGNLDEQGWDCDTEERKKP